MLTASPALMFDLTTVVALATSIFRVDSDSTMSLKWLPMESSPLPRYISTNCGSEVVGVVGRSVDDRCDDRSSQAQPPPRSTTAAAALTSLSTDKAVLGARCREALTVASVVGVEDEDENGENDGDTGNDGSSVDKFNSRLGFFEKLCWDSGKGSVLTEVDLSW
jgi:hypothetical protein